MKKAVLIGRVKSKGKKAGQCVMIAGLDTPVRKQREIMKALRQTGVIDEGELEEIFLFNTGPGKAKRYKFNHLPGRESRCNVPDTIDELTPLVEDELIAILTKLEADGVEVTYPAFTRFKRKKDDKKTKIKVDFCADHEVTKDAIREARKNAADAEDGSAAKDGPDEDPPTKDSPGGAKKDSNTNH